MMTPRRVRYASAREEIFEPPKFRTPKHLANVVLCSLEPEMQIKSGIQSFPEKKAQLVRERNMEPGNNKYVLYTSRYQFVRFKGGIARSGGGISTEIWLFTLP